MILDVISACKDIINSSFRVNYDKTTRVKTFIPEDRPAICYEVDKIREDRQSMNQFDADDLFSLNIYYIERATINRDQIGFIRTVNDIVETLRDSGTLQDTVQYFNSDIQMNDRKVEDNMEFVARIKLTGKLV